MLSTTQDIVYIMCPFRQKAGKSRIIHPHVTNFCEMASDTFIYPHVYLAAHTVRLTFAYAHGLIEKGVFSFSEHKYVEILMLDAW